MTGTESLPLADTSDMIGVHNVFRNALDDAPRLVGSVADGDVARADVVAAYYDNVLRLLQAHHEGEDELLTPRLVPRCTPEEATVVSAVAAQHEAVTRTLADSLRQVAEWRGAPTAELRQSLLATLAGLRGTLSQHLSDEEARVLPIAARYLNVAEWGELPGHAMRTFDGDRMWLVLGLVQEQMTPDQIAEMQAHMPPPLLEYWVGPGRQMFQEFSVDLRR